MINFDFKRSGRKCSRSGRTFEIGEEFVSMLIDENGVLVRQDIGDDKWGGPPEECIGWWKSRVPDLEKGRVYWAPKDVLLAFFEHLISQANEPDKIYVMAILLLQRKHLKLLDSIEENGQETMVLVNASTKEKFELATVSISADRIQSIQDELAEKLFTDIAPTQD